MANVIIFDEAINSTTIADLIDIIEEKRSFDDDKIILYFTTDGGYTHSANTFIHYMKNNPINLRFICVGAIQSAGFHIITSLKYDYEIEISDTCWGMAHKCYNTNIDKSLRGELLRYIKHNILKKKDDEYYYIQFVDDENKKILKTLNNLDLGKEQINLFKNGKDVYIRNKDMKKLFE